MTTVVPPAAGPVAGLMPVTVGGSGDTLKVLLVAVMVALLVGAPDIDRVASSDVFSSTGEMVRPLSVRVLEEKAAGVYPLSVPGLGRFALSSILLTLPSAKTFPLSLNCTTGGGGIAVLTSVLLGWVLKARLKLVCTAPASTQEEVP